MKNNTNKNSIISKDGVSYLIPFILITSCFASVSYTHLTPKQKVEMLSAARLLQQKGYKLFATGGTSKFLTENGVENTQVYWPSETNQQPQALDMLHKKEIDMVVNIPKNLTAGELSNGYKIRRAAIDLNVPLITNARLASAFINAFCTMTLDDLAIKSWAEYK